MRTTDWLRSLFLVSLVSPLCAAPVDAWKLAQDHSDSHRFSTLFTAHDVRRSLASEEGLTKAIEWCRQTAVTKVYVETFRDGFQAAREDLIRARDRFLQAGIAVSGCVTPTQVGKKSNRWNIIACYTDTPTQERIREIFEYTAGMFDEIMIDDFWFTDCSCPECDHARIARTVKLGGRSYRVNGETWEDYRRVLMTTLSREYVLGAARRVNSKSKLIIKFPQWYDTFHERGYDVAGETRDFDRIWVGTETRDYDDKQWGGTPQYEAYFIMRWLGGLGGAKCGGGWYDWLGTTEATYLEQARQTILAGARESMLFCYGGLQGSTGPKNIETLRANLPELFAVAQETGRRKITGVATYKPANSHPGKEARVYDFVGMLGVPLVPGHEFPRHAESAFFSMHALKDPKFIPRLRAFIRSGKPVLLTDGLAAKVGEQLRLDVPNVRILQVQGSPKSLLTMDQKTVGELRTFLLKPLKKSFAAPPRVGLYLFADGSWVVENFNEEPTNCVLNGETLTVPARGWLQRWRP